jgi:SAM-dependent methyltransferase
VTASAASNTAFYELRAAQKSPTSDNPEMLALMSRIADWCRLKPGDRVLDFGCFDGWLLRKLRERHSIQGTGLDISHQALALARDLDHSGALTFVRSDGAPLPFESESFDVVVCSEILEHVPDLDAVMAELARVLACGGMLYATMPNALEHVFPPLRGTCRVVDRVEGHVRRLTRSELVALLRRHGLEPVKIQYRGFVLSAIWYRIFIYSPRVNRRVVGLVSSRQRLVSTVAKEVAFALMRLYLAFDRRFASYCGLMGIEAVAKKA